MTPKRDEPPKLELSKAILDFETLLNTEIPERKKILPWLPEGGLAMVFGQRGLGKTFFGLSLTAAVSQGKPFMRWLIDEPYGVLYIDGEMWLGDIRERLTGFLHAIPPKPLHIFSHEIFFERFERDLVITQSDVQEGILSLLDASNDVQFVVKYLSKTFQAFLERAGGVPQTRFSSLKKGFAGTSLFPGSTPPARS